MTRATSAFLDILRLSAAFVVFLAHTVLYWNPSMAGPMQGVAHHAVLVFFVLSGYVIAYTTTEKCRTVRAYAIGRLSRLYSVVVPALLLTAVLGFLGSELDASFYAHYGRTGTELRYLLTLAHLNEIWFLDAYPPTNAPFWSLGYEAPYYLLLGVFWFVKPSKMRWVALVVCALVIGPKVLLLLPVWLAGVAACLWRDRMVIGHRVAVLGYFVAVGATAAVVCWLPPWPQAVGAAPWYFSGAALSDFMTGLGWAAMIWFFHRAFGQMRVGDGFQRVVRWSASHTFSLYLYHAPLVVFTTALVPPVGMGLGQVLCVMTGILLLIIILGVITESQRSRWQLFFGWIWDRSAGVFAKLAESR